MYHCRLWTPFSTESKQNVDAYLRKNRESKTVLSSSHPVSTHVEVPSEVDVNVHSTNLGHIYLTLNVMAGGGGG